MIFQGKSEGFDSCDRPSNLTQTGFNFFLVFRPYDLEIRWMNSKNNRVPLLCYVKLCLEAISEFKLELQSGNAQFSSKVVIFLSCVTLKFDEWHWKITGHLFYTTTSSLGINWKPLVNSNWSYSPETLNSGKNRHFLSCVTLKFDRWPWKTIGHLSWATSSFVHHFIAISQFKLGLWSRNAWIGFWPLWAWPLTSDLLHGHHFCHW